jgi:hypothetical protein
MTTDANAGDGGGHPHAAIQPVRFYTIGQAARLSGFGRAVLTARCDSGRLPCVRPPGCPHGWRKVLGADLLAFVIAGGAKLPDPPKASAAKPRPVRSNTGAKLKAAFAELKAMGLA